MRGRVLSPLLLLASFLVHAPLIPGGPIETRVFPDMPVWLATAYNVVITIVGLGSVPLAYLARRGGPVVLRLVLADAVGYATIYGCDLTGLVPQPPPFLPEAVRNFEVAGFLVALAIAASVVRDIIRPKPEPGYSPTIYISFAVVSFLVLAAAGAGIVYFGTVNALH
jgi:hypothetical protein